MDDVIFEEFKGTGNMELILDRKLADRRIFPAIDVVRSGTRKEELLLTNYEIDWMWHFRKAVAGMAPVDAMELMLDRIKRTKNNFELMQAFRETRR